jgi:hypothetical protein
MAVECRSDGGGLNGELKCLKAQIQGENNDSQLMEK